MGPGSAFLFVTFIYGVFTMRVVLLRIHIWVPYLFGALRFTRCSARDGPLSRPCTTNPEGLSAEIPETLVEILQGGPQRCVQILGIQKTAQQHIVDVLHLGCRTGIEFRAWRLV